MRLPTDSDLVQWQLDLESVLTHLADTDLRQATARISDPAVHDAAAVYITRPSKRLLGMAFLHAAHTLGVTVHDGDLVAVAAALEVRHGGILLHDDIVDGDTQRGGQPTAHHALAGPFGSEAASAALFAGDVLAGIAPLPILRSALPSGLRARLTEIVQRTTAEVASGQTEQLHLDAVQDPQAVTQDTILRVHSGQFAPYLLCSLHLAAALVEHDNTVLERITEAGLTLCQAFQVQNDLAGFRELARVLGSEEPIDSVLTLANTSDLARRRRTVLVRAALDHLPSADRDRLLAYLNGADDDLTAITRLIHDSRAEDICAGLVIDLQIQARERITTDPHLPAPVRTALSATFGYMTALYDPASPTSRLYLQARPELQSAA
ncbi:polyprenyl synthetase family protein [Streptomyces sp. NBC_00988]|uniref:polyprenyl synthetase family protein n=1 Tax=Streptomyces sp. NBC_00988 TaxID=2903704 RepID=UPI003870C4BD|nr:polyprenyl synthetase family protein [Streptomyces sp. NBC_00988]